MFSQEAHGGLTGHLQAQIRVKFVSYVHESSHGLVAQELEVSHTLVACTPVSNMYPSFHSLSTVILKVLAASKQRPYCGIIQYYARQASTKHFILFYCNS